MTGPRLRIPGVAADGPVDRATGLQTGRMHDPFFRTAAGPSAAAATFAEGGMGEFEAVLGVSSLLRLVPRTQRGPPNRAARMKSWCRNSMLSKLTATRRAGRGGAGARFVIIASQYNLKYVDAMVRAAVAALKAGGARPVKVIRVPGAFEIPVVAAHLASQGAAAPDAILCLGVILRGATTHAQHIGEAVSSALAAIQVRYRVPVIHEVLLLENKDQARQRCLDRDHNRGAEAAQTALAMAAVMRSLVQPG